MARQRQSVTRDGSLRNFGVKADTLIEENVNVVLNNGIAEPARAGPGLIFVGVARQTIAGGLADGDERVVVARLITLWENSETDPVELTAIGQAVFIEDETTVAATDAGGTLSPAGTVFDVDASGVWVQPN